MALEPFTTAEDVRAATGVGSEELTDETLALSLYELTLKAELNALGATLVADFNAVDAIDPASNRTAAEQAFHDATRAFSPFAVALKILPMLPMLALKSITDGKAAMSRQSDIDFGALLDSGMQSYHQLRNALAAAYAAYKGTTAASLPAYPSLLITSRGVDPVTGE